MKKSDLKDGLIIQTEHNRFGVVELDKNRIDICYDRVVDDKYKNLEILSLDDVYEFDDNRLGVGFILTKEHKEKYSEFYQDFNVGDLVIAYEIVGIYNLNKLYDNGIGPFPPLILE